MARTPRAQGTFRDAAMKVQLDALHKKLDEFADRVQNNILRRAVTAAVQVPADEIKRLAITALDSEKTHERTGYYIDGIVPKRAKIIRVGGALEVVGGVGMSKKSKHRSLWHLLEFGHALVLAGRSLGFVAPRPHWRPGFRTKQREMMETFEYELGRSIGKEMRKLAGTRRRRR